jgi:signal transduction histidine kinase
MRQRESNTQYTSVRLHEELEQVERMKQRFIRNVSHELRTPLASIEGFARALIRMESAGDSDLNRGALSNGKQAHVGSEATSTDTRKHFLSIISHESQRLGKLIEDVLLLSDCERNNKSTTASLFSALDVFTSVVSSFQNSNQSGSIYLCLVPLPEGPMLYADRESVCELLRQLLSNAFKFSCGQKVILGAELVSISPTHETRSLENGNEPRVNSATRIYVKDCGIGIPKVELDCIFQKFYRVETSEASFAGTGLGLAIVRELVNQNNGRVWVESEEGIGSTFYVMLPNNPPGVR